MLFNTSYKFLGDSVSGTAAKNSTTNIDYKMPDDYMLYGAKLIPSNAVNGDYISFSVIDKDNVLGYGANFVVNTWVKKWYVPTSDASWEVTSPFAGTVPSGLYLRIAYTSTGVLLDVGIKVNFFMVTPD